MKKLLVSVLAIAGLVACNQEQTLVQQGPAPIAFGDAFVEYATRAAEDPSLKTDDLKAFDVWAYMDSYAGTVLEDENVIKYNGQWGYANLQYWTPGHMYYFTAIAPMDSANWEYAQQAETIYFNNEDGTEDLLFATATQDTKGKDIQHDYEAIKLSFNHLLSKTKFTFVNGYKTTNMQVEVSNITMTAPYTAAYDIKNAAWGGYNGEKTLAYGNVDRTAATKNNESTYERLTIPAGADKAYTIEYDITVYAGDVVALEAHREAELTGVTFEAGKAYNFVAEISPETLGLDKIEFEVEIIDWVNGGDIQDEIKVDYTYDENSNIYSAYNADGLKTIVDAIANGEIEADTNITLSGDIDLSQITILSTTAPTVSNWAPVGTPENPYTGTFDGNGYTIKNLTLVESEAKEGKAYIGFFGYAEDATIKNVTFENVYINIPCLDIDHSQGHIGAVAGSLEGTSTIENVTVKGDITVYATQTANGASRVAVVAGGNSFGNVTMKNVHVVANEGSSLIANNNTGALAGQLQGKMYFENCSSNINVTVNKFFAGGLIGIAAGDSKFVDCHTTGDVAVVAGREGRHNDEYRFGGIAGGWADCKTKVCTLENCSYTGKVSGKNADGSVAEPLDYAGYVGRGYTLANCAGSKVVIDGVEYVQKYDNVYGVYTINGCTPVSTADELVAALEANEGVFFMNDIKIDPASMSNAYGATGINIKNGQTIDGNGYTLNIKGAGGTWDSGINTTGGVIRNLTVAGSFRGIFINHTSTHSEEVVLENVTLKDVVYTISCDQGLYQGIKATNCKFYGWTSFAKTAGEAKFVNCYFGEGNGYKYCRPYSNT